LPTGFDPKIVKKNEYAFKQVFGENIRIDGGVKKFVLTVYNKSMPKSFTYNFEQIKPYLSKLEIPIVCGLDRNGEMVVYDMAERPHLLIAGSTGSGKSSQLRSILTTLILTNSPKKIRLVLGDMKKSEFFLFRRVEHVDSISSNPNELRNALLSVEQELKIRGDVLDREEKAHIHDVKGDYPNIIVCIDEVALLQQEKEIMSIVEEISAIGRALGTYVILSQQRSDSQVLNGRLKNNLSAVRMAFRHADRINSSITLGDGTGFDASDISIDTPGRMYLRMDDIIEIQAPYLDLEKAKKLLESFKSKPNKAANKQATNDLSNIFGMLGDE
jgi:S-DNA-T family DNA segregation ATPase FtsK/SpoIIIE